MRIHPSAGLSLFRLRLVDSRILFDVDGGVILIRRIGNRKDVYD